MKNNYSLFFPITYFIINCIIFFGTFFFCMDLLMFQIFSVIMITSCLVYYAIFLFSCINKKHIFQYYILFSIIKNFILLGLFYKHLNVVKNNILVILFFYLCMLFIEIFFLIKTINSEKTSSNK